MKNFIKNNWQILILETIILICFTLFFGKFGDLMVDTFREIYIPQEVLDGQTTYKNIFTIYAPFAYLFNALLFKIFGCSIKTAYLAGLFATLGITFFTYKIASIFTKQAIVICLFLISGLILSPNVFNSFLPYSFGIIYGLLFILISIYCALKNRFPVSYLFYSLAICSKYEFILFLPALIFFSKKQSWLKNLIALVLPPITLFYILQMQGVSLTDIKTSFELTLLMSKTTTFQWFYSVTGLNFRFEHIYHYLVNFLKLLIPLLLIRYKTKIWKFNSDITFYGLIACFILISIGRFQEILIYAFPLILILLIARYKNLNSGEKFFAISSLLISAKVLFALTLQSYGTYFIPFALISLFILIPKEFKKGFLITVTIWSFIIGILNINQLYKKDFSEINPIVEYIKSNSKLEDKVVVYPECLAINVLSERKSDNKFYSLIPMYVETFGEDLIIKRLELTKPQYIIINNYNTSAYYYKEFGSDYAQNIFKWIENNYELKTIIKNSLEYKIYKKI